MNCCASHSDKFTIKREHDRELMFTNNGIHFMANWLVNSISWSAFNILFLTNTLLLGRFVENNSFYRTCSGGRMKSQIRDNNCVTTNKTLRRCI